MDNVLENPACSQSETFQLRDGLLQHLLHWSSDNFSSYPVLLLHGFSNNAHIWNGVATRLQDEFQIYAIDFRGHGDSSWDQQMRYNHEVLVGDVHEVVQHLGIECFHLIGHSLGAQVGALYCQRYQADLASFTIVDVGPEVGSDGARKIREDAESIPATFTSLEEFRKYLANIYGYPYSVIDIDHKKPRSIIEVRIDISTP